MPNVDVYEAVRRRFGSLANRATISCLIFTHRQADPDALCSAGALEYLIRSSLPERNLDVKIISPQGASILGRHVASALGIKFVEEIDPKLIHLADVLFVLDTGDPKLLEPCAEEYRTSDATKIIVDHHPSSTAKETWGGATDRLLSSSSTSTCEIIALGFPAEMIPKPVADMLLTGILFDSQHLGIATKSTLEAALVLVSAGSEIATCKRILRHDPDRSEVLGKLKAAQRIRFEEAAGNIIARSEISSYHAAVARMLVDIGADVGIAYGESGGEARLSVRSSQVFLKKSGIDLAVEIKKVADRYDLIGGGHATAASLSGKIDSAGIVADQLVQNLKSILLQK
jgi:nanoRNase/pAp phosphatase (c-di-AMP/oligoRNAs hydrolase)